LGCKSVRLTNDSRKHYIVVFTYQNTVLKII